MKCPKFQTPSQLSLHTPPAKNKLPFILNTKIKDKGKTTLDHVHNSKVEASNTTPSMIHSNKIVTFML